MAGGQRRELVRHDQLAGHLGQRLYVLVNIGFTCIAAVNEGRFADADIYTDAGAVTEFKLPAALFVGREFVVDVRLDGPADRVATRRTGCVSQRPPLPLGR